MVPHIRVEEKLQELANATDQVFVVTGGPDEKKGERLLVLHTLDEDHLKDCLSRLDQTGLPNLWVPRPGRSSRWTRFRTWAGKLDLRKIRELRWDLQTRSIDYLGTPERAGE
jgi:acyl-[acyl-carrier-protein]-phospholipid O-acyltransferase/long-chain-fatty-acid--[acyl-carrier-protein] ligase